MQVMEMRLAGAAVALLAFAGVAGAALAFDAGWVGAVGAF